MTAGQQLIVSCKDHNKACSNVRGTTNWLTDIGHKLLIPICSDKETYIVLTVTQTNMLKEIIFVRIIKIGVTHWQTVL